MRLADLERHRRLLVWLIAIGIGSAVFFLWIGYARTLDPRDLRWIFHEDPFTHVMGWEQYRNAPLLQYPITKNELYGLEWSSTIVFTDSIPIVALVLRPISGLLPHPCQYLGWWVWLSLILQAYWGARLVLLRTDRLRDAALGCVFFVTTPVVLERLGLQTGVGSHWLLLWALWLYFSARGPSTRSWVGLLVLTVSVHAYLFVMVGAIWIAHLVACRMRGQLARRDLAYAGAALAAIVVWMHVLGYFLVGGGAAGGTWRSNFDLVGFLSPSHGARLGVLPSYYNDPWDGSAYLGAGILVLLVANGVAWKVRRPARSASPVPWLPLVVAMLGLAAFAITNDVTFAHHTLVSLPLPHAFDGLYETFRGATRMIWPAYYAIVLGTLWLVLRAWPARAVTWVLGVGLGLQLVDLSGVATLKRDEIRGDGIMRPLADPIWAQVAEHDRRIISVPAYHRQADWPTFAWFAARNGLGSNIGYLSRSNPVVRAAGTRAHLEAVATGNYDPGTVYYFPSSVLWDVGRRTMGPQDLAVIADGFHLIVPGARAWADASRLVPPPAETPLLGSWISFADPDHAGLLVEGWSWPEQWGTWSIAKSATLVLPVPTHERVRVSFKWLTSQPLGHTQSLRVHLGDEVFAVQFTRRGVPRKDTFEVTTTGRLLDVELEVGELDQKFNVRPMGIGLVAARVQRATDPIDDELPAAARGTPVLDSWISFAADAPGRALLANGWSFGEPWGTWSEDPEAVLALPVPANERIQLGFRWLGSKPPHGGQTAHVLVDDQPFDVTFPANDQDVETSFEVTTRRGWVVVRLAIDHAVTQSDGRMLGVALKAARVHVIAP